MSAIRSNKRNSTSINYDDNDNNNNDHNSTAVVVTTNNNDKNNDNDDNDNDTAAALTTNPSNDQQHDKENTTTTTTTTTNATKSSRKSSSKSSTNTTTTTSSSSSNRPPAEAGIIHSIYCENFMCHRKLTVDLNRNVTFIHGQNGSGKSAVLAAIQICLGANARRTHRARNLKDLVRRDATSSSPSNHNHNITGAKIRVTLHNRGSDAYQHSIYGDTITVERTISLKAGGDNGYKLLDHHHVIQSKSKKDLDDMLDTLNIQVDNPVAVLDQEEAKKFLTGKAEDKYNFFMKATELERVDRTYASTLDTITELQDINIRIKEGLQTSYEHVEDLKRKWNEHQELDKLELKRSQLGTDYAWSLYNESDVLYQKNYEAKQQVVERITKKEEELRIAEEEAGAQADGTNKRNRVDTLLLEAQHQAETKRTLEEELKVALAPYKQLERDIGSTTKSQNAARNQLRRAQTNLEETRAQIMAMADSAESEEARCTAMLKQAEEELAAARDKVDILKQEQTNWLRSYEEMEPHVRHLKSKVDSQSKQIQGVQNTLRSLQSSNGQDMLALLGSRVSTVANLIQRYRDQNKFKGEVIGPIGLFIKVAPGMDEFAMVAEFAIGYNTLDRFIATNDHDASLLRQIRKQAGCMQDCGIFQIDPSPRYQIPGPLAYDGIVRVSSVFSIENDVVFNCLIDNTRMEHKAVARDRKLSQDKLLTKNGNHHTIRDSINDVYLPTGDYWTVKSGSLAMFSNEKKLRQTIGVDRTAAIADAQNQLSTLEEELRKIQKEESKLQSEHTNAQRQWTQAKRAVTQNSTTIASIMERIESIREEMKASNNQTVDTSELEEDIQQAEDLLARHKATEEKFLAEREALLPHINELKDRLEESSIRNAKILEDISVAERELTQFLETQTQQNDKLEKKRQKLQKYQDDLVILKQQLESIATRRDDFLTKARTMHFRVQQQQHRSSQMDNEGESQQSQADIRVEPTEDELEAIEPIVCKHEPSWYELRLKKIDDKIRTEKSRRNILTEDAATVYERYAKAKADLSAKTDQVAETDNRIEDLQKDIDMRRKRWRQFRKHLAKSTGLKFDEMLTMNKYTGTLEFDDENRTLDLQVQKDTADTQAESKDVKALSGGERSYTTMALLVALGETLETPFRILDEFDVFMDAETRKLVIKSLIHVAKKLQHRQFIFITPQDLSGINADDQVRILRMHPPDRHQNAGGLTQQVLPFTASQN